MIEFSDLRGAANLWHDRIKADSTIGREDKKTLLQSLRVLREYAAKRMDEAERKEPKP